MDSTEQAAVRDAVFENDTALLNFLTESAQPVQNRHLVADAPAYTINLAGVDETLGSSRVRKRLLDIQKSGRINSLNRRQRDLLLSALKQLPPE
jgi:hypothetical protein